MIGRITQVFEQEFTPLKEKFDIYHLTIVEAVSSEASTVGHPGVYIVWFGSSIVKVGRSITNARKRALEHIRDNTSNDHFSMSDLAEHDDINTSGIVLITCKNPDEYFWAASLECYLEKELDPIIRSGRVC